MSALPAPEWWQPMPSWDRAKWIAALDMNAQTKMTAHALFALVPLLADEGYRDAAYTAERVAVRTLYEMHRLAETP